MDAGSSTLVGNDGDPQRFHGNVNTTAKRTVCDRADLTPGPKPPGVAATEPFGRVTDKPNPDPQQRQSQPSATTKFAAFYPWCMPISPKDRLILQVARTDITIRRNGKAFDSAPSWLPYPPTATCRNVTGPLNMTQQRER
jgi:hypothetical protein